MHQSLPKTIDYIEMPSRNLEATKKFFTGLFGWSFQDYGPDYAAFDDGRTTGGFYVSETTSNIAGGAPLVVFYSDALEQMVKEVARLGGKVTREIFRIPWRAPLSLRGARRRRIRDLVSLIERPRGWGLTKNSSLTDTQSAPFLRNYWESERVERV